MLQDATAFLGDVEYKFRTEYAVHVIVADANVSMWDILFHNAQSFRIIGADDWNTSWGYLARRYHE